MRNRCLHCWGRRGLTLLEVVVALALVSTLLVGLLVAARRHAGQIERSRRTLDVVARVDALVYRWLGKGGLVLQEGQGDLPGDDGLVWKTELVDSSYRQELGIDVFRLSVLAKKDPPGQPPIVSLELASVWPDWSGEGESP